MRLLQLIYSEKDCCRKSKLTCFTRLCSCLHPSEVEVVAGAPEGAVARILATAISLEGEGLQNAALMFENSCCTVSRALGAQKDLIPLTG